MSARPEIEEAITRYNRRDWGRLLCGRLPPYTPAVHASFAEKLLQERDEARSEAEALRDAIETDAFKFP